VIDDLPTPAAPSGVAPFASTAVAAPPLRWLWPVLALLAALSAASLVVAWKAEQRGAALEQQLVLRQQEAATQATEARTFAKQAREAASDSAAKVALLEARVAEVATQRTQLEELIQSLSRSRDENVLVDIEAAIRVAQQQAAITGSTEPLAATLRQADERLARYNQPRLEGVRRAIARDLDRVKATSVADIASLGIKLDEAIRLVDELPLLSVADPRTVVEATGPAPGGAAPAASPVSKGWGGRFIETWSAFGETVWSEAKSLVRVTRIDHPEAALMAPEQSFFVRENLKLRLLNARLALLSRQFDTAQADLQAARSALDRYFDRGAKRTTVATELIRQVVAQARQVNVPRPDDTLAALTAAGVGR
jgi:uroporphyrin-III C-methyltransferase